MSYPGLVCLAMCSLVVVLTAAALPYVTSSAREADHRHLPGWLALTALILLLAATLLVRQHTPSDGQVVHAVLASALLIGGVFLKWLLDLAARKPLALHERTLAIALLLAPLAPLLWPAAFDTQLVPRVLLLWFANGFIWQTLVGDLERIAEKERVIVRRREPPDPALRAGGISESDEWPPEPVGPRSLRGRGRAGRPSLPHTR